MACVYVHVGVWAYVRVYDVCVGVGGECERVCVQQHESVSIA